MRRGYVTVFYTIAIALILSLLTVMFEGIKDNAARMKAVCALDTAMTSIFAEYNKALWDRYGLIFVDSGYMSKTSSMGLSEEHLRNFLNENFDECRLGISGGKDLLKLQCTEAEATAVCLASDDNGAAIKRQAVNLMKYHYKLAYSDVVDDWIADIGEHGLSEGASYENAVSAAGELNAEYHIDYSGWLPSQTGGNDISEDTPGIFSILALVTDTDGLSTVKIDPKLYAAERKLNTGNLEKETEGETGDFFFLREYLYRFTSNYRNDENRGVLTYETEYLVSGKVSDVDNLSSVVRRIFVIREAANQLTLCSDSEKLEKIETFCEIVCSLVGCPEAAELLALVVMAAMVSAESIADLRIIMDGGRVPLIKSSDQWISGLGLGLFTGYDGSDYTEGLSYGDYLKIFMYLTGENKLMSRFMSLIEMNVRATEGNENFRIDCCFDEIQFLVRISSDYGYTYTAQRRKAVE